MNTAGTIITAQAAIQVLSNQSFPINSAPHWLGTSAKTDPPESADASECRHGRFDCRVRAPSGQHQSLEQLRRALRDEPPVSPTSSVPMSHSDRRLPASGGLL
jgi:hypothetical protein